MFRKVLIANRGEIAVRITRTLQELGVTSAAVHSDADRAALHVQVADEAFALAGNSSADTYLRGDKIIDIARANDVDAIHPGYGFLSENAEFAEQCAAARITFIGPSPKVIRAMGDKIVARRTAEQAGVPVVPGWSGDAEAITADTLAPEAERIGYPVMLKAAAGGGGKGMRIVRERGELADALAAAQREAAGAFGDARIFLEKYIDRSRHIEFQIFGDAKGNAFHFFERECSIQRRHQKIIEESPSPFLTPERRDAMADAAIKVASALGYTNAGTVEFIVAPDGTFYFLEVNTRLQVEHPVTEMTLGHDLVRAQLAVAAGEQLPFSQASLEPRGHALECRIYAEDPAHGFLPSTGSIEVYEEPTGPNIRVDSGVRAGSVVQVHYDPMLAKLVVWGRTREEAIDRMHAALRRYVILGVTTNIDFLQDVITHPDFRSGAIDTHFLEREQVVTLHKPSTEAIAAAAIAVSNAQPSRRTASQEADASTSAGPWENHSHWRVASGEGT